MSGAVSRNGVVYGAFTIEGAGALPWSREDAALLARGIVRTPGGDVRMPVSLRPGAWIAGSRCKGCGALKVHIAGPARRHFCFGCGVVQ